MANPSMMPTMQIVSPECPKCGGPVRPTKVTVCVYCDSLLVATASPEGTVLGRDDAVDATTLRQVETLIAKGRSEHAAQLLERQTGRPRAEVDAVVEACAKTVVTDAQTVSPRHLVIVGVVALLFLLFLSSGVAVLIHFAYDNTQNLSVLLLLGAVLCGLVLVYGVQPALRSARYLATGKKGTATVVRWAHAATDLQGLHVARILADVRGDKGDEVFRAELLFPYRAKKAYPLAPGISFPVRYLPGQPDSVRSLGNPSIEAVRKQLRSQAGKTGANRRPFDTVEPNKHAALKAFGALLGLLLGLFMVGTLAQAGYRSASPGTVNPFHGHWAANQVFERADRRAEGKTVWAWFTPDMSSSMSSALSLLARLPWPEPAQQSETTEAAELPPTPPVPPPPATEASGVRRPTPPIAAEVRGREALLTRVEVYDTEEQYVIAYDAETLDVLYEIGPLGTAGQARGENRLVVRGKFIALADYRGTFHVIDLESGEEQRSLLLTDRTYQLCATLPGEAPQVWVSIIDERDVMVDLESGEATPSERPDTCPPPWERYQIDYEQSQKQIKAAPKMSGFEATSVFLEEDHAVLSGVKSPGTAVPLLVGFDPRDGKLLFQVEMSSVNRLDVIGGSNLLGALAGGRFVGVYASTHDKIHLTTFDARTGAHLWESERTQSRWRPTWLQITPSSVVVEYEYGFAVHDAKTGELRGIVGRR